MTSRVKYQPIRCASLGLCLAIGLMGGTAAADVPFPRLKPGSQAASSSQQAIAPRYFATTTPYPIQKPAQSHAIMRRPVIVIDPGHGGRDPGAVGTKGTLEKTITTAAATELAKRLRRSGRYDVIVTRFKDRYIDHDERLRIARKGHADLFISLHADSAKNNTARGASVYTLSDRAKGRSRKIVNNQNWILDVDLSTQSDPVGDILVDLAQRKTESQSDSFANILLEELAGKTTLVNNSHREAGYYVLLAPDVPAVLLELGFLSNPKDEKLLNSSRHRAKILTAVERAIDRYMAQL